MNSTKLYTTVLHSFNFVFNQIHTFIKKQSFVYQIADPDIFETVKEFKEKCETEAAEIKKCPDCYEAWKNDESDAKSEYFKLVCPKPHLVVLYIVRLLEGHPIWPAKLFHVKDGMATVACFADHEEDIVPIRDCFLYSEKIPRSKNKKYQRKLNLAYKVIEIHYQFSFQAYQLQFSLLNS